MVYKKIAAPYSKWGFIQPEAAWRIRALLIGIHEGRKNHRKVCTDDRPFQYPRDRFIGDSLFSDVSMQSIPYNTGCE